MCPYSYFCCCGYFWVTRDDFSVWVTKITSMIGVSWTHSLRFCFWTILTQWIMAILSKGCKPDKSESYNSLKFSFTNFYKLSWHTCSVWNKIGWLNWFWLYFSVISQGLSSINPKWVYCSYAWSCSLCEGRSSFYMVSQENSVDSYVFDWCTWLSAFFLFPQSTTFFVCMPDVFISSSFTVCIGVSPPPPSKTPPSFSSIPSHRNLQTV